MGMKAISGDIVDTSPSAILFAISGDPDDTIWIPKSVVLEGEADEPEDEVDLLIEAWWYNQHEERFG